LKTQESDKIPGDSYLAVPHYLPVSNAIYTNILQSVSRIFPLWECQQNRVSSTFISRIALP